MHAFIRTPTPGMFSGFKRTCEPCDTYRLAIPAFLTAEEIALMAVHMELRSVVSSPVPLAFRPSSRTNLVSVITLVSKAPLSDIVSSSLWSWKAKGTGRQKGWTWVWCRSLRDLLGGVCAGKPIRRGIYTHLVRQDFILIKVHRLWSLQHILNTSLLLMHALYAAEKDDYNKEARPQ